MKMEKKYACYKLNFRTGLHLGERTGWYEGSEDFIHSDTLFSAITHAYLLIYGKDEIEKMLDLFLNDTPPFLISSAFPFMDSRFYMPVPLNQIPNTAEAKDLKAVRFVERARFERIIANESSINDKYEIEDFIWKENRYCSFINKPRINISRLNNHPEKYFHYGEITFNENNGLYFLVDFKNSDFEKKFNSALNLLQDEGIGGDRTVGKGFFRYEKKEMTIRTLDSHNASVMLSLCLPNEKEFDGLSDGFYEILERKGYIYSPMGRNMKRDKLRMFVEGSVLPFSIVGKMEDVTPQGFGFHKIYRYGYCFSIPMKLGSIHENKD